MSVAEFSLHSDFILHFFTLVSSIEIEIEVGLFCSYILLPIVQGFKILNISFKESYLYVLIINFPLSIFYYGVKNTLFHFHF